MARRIFAYVLDTIIALVIVAAIGIPAFNSVADKTIYHSADSAQAACDNRTSGGICFNAGDTVYLVPANKVGDLYAPTYGVAAAVGLLNFVVLQSLLGGSIGKLLLGLRVVRGDTGKQAGFGSNFLRWILLFVDGVCCLVGLITSFTTKGHRRVGDMVAGTNVVRKNDVGRPVMEIIAPAGYGAPGGWPGAPAPTPGTWGAPAGPAGPPAPGSWAPPGGPPAGAAPAGPAGPAGPAAATPGDGPQWDAARNAYIQYERAQGAWVQFDDAAQAWRPISQ
ncbi:MAG: hypothetical protein JWM89_3242 [Acidimicrobiales bacterium]|nr:hypothetical protein [Acidimicrobiales bacterium]